MKFQTYSRIPYVAIFALALVSGSHNVFAQDAPEIEAFIEGIDNYDDYSDPVISRPDLSGGRDLPPNELPSADSDDFVVAPNLVPEQVNEPAKAAVAETKEDSNTNPDTFVNDYFDQHYYTDPKPPVARTWVLGITVPIFDREFDGDRLFSVNPADLTQTLRSNNADPNGTSGIDINLARRSSTGWGFEARYWGLYSSAATSVLGGNPTTVLNGLGQINDNGVALSDTFNTADFHQLTRDYSFNNVELNLLRNKRNFAPLGRCLTTERLYGLRFMQFDESLEYAGVSSTNAVIRSALNSSVENSLFGIQTGCRAEWQAFSRASLTIGGKLGLFNNRARTTIGASNQAANLDFSTPVVSSGSNAGAAFQFGDRKDDLSLMGEFDLGLAYHLTQRSRFRIGYRVLGVSEIADAEKNIPTDFTNVTELQSANTDGDLVLRGGYVGLEFGF
jgi:hypothetical protein